ncbi:T3SS effector HopA1 family protein [Emticicia sp. BO119]|uniref:T3SS effector HopA1 family protein n=1 Tax=Emticicia sp. BO119 TaxID=2757768 RepID=UPI0015EFDFF6|nr:T3SS effector HopA1 family protein [Emticicia sp. BO119]MBA4853233.1 hypothetical protein [Emticicia sp. BO119]
MRAIKKPYNELLRDEFIEILNLIIEENFFSSEKKHIGSSSSDSTAVRVLLSEEYYEKFKDYYIQTNALHRFIYDIYSRDLKNLSSYSETDNEFNKYFKENRPVKELFWQSSYWHYDSDFGVLRKESLKKLEAKGRYYEKELINDPNTLDNKPYQNAEKIHPTHVFNDISKDNKENYNWIYGKYDFVDEYYIRFYWNFYPKKNLISRFLKTIQTSFDNNKIPFQFKFLSNINNYKTHADVGVLYLPRKHILICLEIVRDIHKEFNEHLFFKKKKPMFTYPLKRGLSFGENPDDRRYTSFGSYRAIHISMAIIDFYFIQKHNRVPDVDELINLLNQKKCKQPELTDCPHKKGCETTAFVDCPYRKNIDWTTQFYINEFSKYNYQEEFQFFSKTYFRNRKLIIVPPKDLSIKNDWIYENRENKRKKYLFTAVQIGNLLCKEAIWYKPSAKSKGNSLVDESEKPNISYPLNCNWLSFKKIINNQISVKIGYQFAALDETFIEGRFGVAYFLMMLNRAYKDETFYRTGYRALEGAFNLISDDSEENYVAELGWALPEMTDTLLQEVFSKYYTKVNIPDRESFKIKIDRQPNAWREEKFKNVIDKVVSTDRIFLSQKELSIVDEILMDYFDVDRPFGNALGTDEFCATLKDGYALLGYFFLRLYDSRSFRKLPFQFN